MIALALSAILDKIPAIPPILPMLTLVWAGLWQGWVWLSKNW